MDPRCKTARKIWKKGDRVVVWNGQEYDGETGWIYSVPSPRHANWLYTVNFDRQDMEHTCIFCAFNEMEPLAQQRLAELEAAGIFITQKTLF